MVINKTTKQKVRLLTENNLLNKECFRQQQQQSFNIIHYLHGLFLFYSFRIIITI
jgi:hypothetical protein